MGTEPSTPPLEPVRSIVAALAARGMPVAVGGSAVLAALGLVDTVRDWDVTVEGDPDTVADILESLGLTAVDLNETVPPFATDRRFVVDGGDHDLDVLVGFALLDRGRPWRVPVRVFRHWRGLPIAHPADWERAYRLMGRTDRADSLGRHPEASAWMGR
jgi:hypothetical protein